MLRHRSRYHVFLSYSRGESTTVLGFTEELCASLQEKGINIIANSPLPKYSRDVGTTLEEIDQQCLGAIVVLSQNYAYSNWCLDELEKILESKRVLGREVFPVFYGVHPSDVRHQKKSFAEALERLKEEEVQKWRCSLKEVANISGWQSKNYENNEAKLIKDIVESVWKKIYPKIPSCRDDLVGIDSRIKKMDSLLSIELKEEVRFIGIWGMGGIGKTTLARVVFEKIRDKFGMSCFLDNVREICGKRDGMVSLQRTIISHLKIKDLEIKDVDEGKNKVRDHLFNKKVLLVLDDVDDMSQLLNLAEKQEWFGPGSRVMITTRDKQLLTSHGIDQIYEIDFLNSDESLQFLYQKASFQNDQPQEHCLELSKEVVQYAGGLPMALEVLCSFLGGNYQASQWKEVLDTIKEDPSYEIAMQSLRRSYNGLGRHYKTLFLDLACFFKGWEKELVTQILENCGRYPPMGIELLIEKSLVSYDGLPLEMHGLLQQMGKDIVFEECPTDASKRSRLWTTKHIDEVLQGSQPTDLIQGIVLNSSTEPYEAVWDPEALSKIPNLKILIINFHNMKIPLGLKSLCSSLNVLHWMEYPLEALPLGLHEIVDLKMHQSKMKIIWKGTQPFAKLKFIDLSFSKDLIQTPIVSGIPCLETLLLEGCTKLVEVHQSVGMHKKLVKLNLKDCINLQRLPRKLKMDSLEELILYGCSRVKVLPAFGENMQCLSLLSLEDCKNLVHLPNSICNLKSLRRLSISGCSRLSWLPKMNENGSLEELDLSGTAIREITSSKIRFKNLEGASGSKEPVSKSNSWNLVQWISKFRKQARVKVLSCYLLT